jgi:uncharacterized protein YcbX
MRVSSLHIYPVKGCHRLDVQTAQVQPWGLLGDRRWVPVDADGHMVSQREIPRLTQVQPTLLDGGVRLSTPGQPDLDLPALAGGYEEIQVWQSRFKASPAGPAADEWLTRAAGHPLRLMWMDDPNRRPVDPAYASPGDVVSAADGYPLLLVSTASLAALNDWIIEDGGEPVPVTRFRPNVVIDGAPAWAEDGWTGRRIRIGAVTFRMPKPCARCVMTTNDQETGERGREPLRTLGRYRNVDQQLLFGMNLIPDDTGTLRAGDPVTVIG